VGTFPAGAPPDRRTGHSTIDIVATHVQPRVGVTERRAARFGRDPVGESATVDRFDRSAFTP
jgi:hypothetical protein